MRLSSFEINSIKQTYSDIFQNGNIYLFGSRTDDNLKGGDIDLFITIDNLTNRLEKKLEFLTALKQKIGDQKIDVVISKDKNRMIEKEALAHGILL